MDHHHERRYVISRRAKMRLTAALISILLAASALLLTPTTRHQLSPATLYSSSFYPAHRQLLSLSQYTDPKSTSLRTDIAVPISDQSQPLNLQQYQLQQHPSLQITPYNIDNAILAIKAFRYQAFFFLYDSSTDAFIVIHNAEKCINGCQRIYRVAATVAFALRYNFPDRFRSGQEELIFLMSTGDAPRLRGPCLLEQRRYCKSDEFAPILQFGSVYADGKMMPSMIAMPQPVRPHLPCFEEWQLTIMLDGTNGNGAGVGKVCQDLQPRGNANVGKIHDGLVFNALGLTWDDLIPQIIWRGTDFMFLHTMYPQMRYPDYEADVEPKIAEVVDGGNECDVTRAAIQALWEMGDELLPRWRGVLLTSEAELQAKEQSMATSNNPEALPWINIKFANLIMNGVKTPATQSEGYAKMQNVGIAVIGEYVSMMEQSKYKYHIDLGGGGGTTWTGTIEKLAMPGALFHHVTATSDWFFDMLQPFVHYIPIRSDLSDLREKYEWAEAHPMETQRIAEAGTEFARWVGSVKGFDELYRRYLLDPLAKVIGAYQPLPS
ncbi:predicted protein, partial [Thalassiosira pseudonana CCMP1335]